jgi:hypothetical protein
VRIQRVAAVAAIAVAAATPVLASASTQLPPGPLLRAGMSAAPQPGDPVQPPPVSLPVWVDRPVYGTPWPGNMAYYGGRVMLHPRVYVDLWGWHRGAEPNRYARALTEFFRGVGGSAWAGVATQYYQQRPDGTRDYISNPRHQLAGVWQDPKAPPSNAYPETYVGAEAVRAARHFHVESDPNALVIVASPHGRNPSGFVDGGYCAWHSWTDGTAYVNLPYLLDTSGGCGSGFVNDGPAGLYDGVSMVAGHEYLEALTDPGVGYAEPGGGWRGIDGQENADKCEWIAAGRPGGAVDITLSTGRFAVQTTWSNVGMSGLGECAAS